MSEDPSIAQWDDIEDEGVLDGSDTLDDDLVADPLDAGIVAGEKWLAAHRFGTTAEEARRGQTLDRRLSEEEPELDPYADDPQDEDDFSRRGAERDPRAGRLVSFDDGLGRDNESDSIAWDAGVAGGGASAEEAAVHLVDDPDGPGEGPTV